MPIPSKMEIATISFQKLNHEFTQMDTKKMNPFILDGMESESHNHTRVDCI